MNDVIFALKYYLIVTHGQGLTMLFYINQFLLRCRHPLLSNRIQCLNNHYGDVYTDACIDFSATRVIGHWRSAVLTVKEIKCSQFWLGYVDYWQDNNDILHHYPLQFVT